MMFRFADLWGHRRHLSPSLRLQESWISLNSMQFSFIILEYGYIMFAWQIILWNGWWPYNVYAEHLSDLKAKVCHFSEPTRCCIEPVKHYFTDFSWILIFLPTSFMQNMKENQTMHTWLSHFHCSKGPVTRLKREIYLHSPIAPCEWWNICLSCVLNYGCHGVVLARPQMVRGP